VPRYQPISDFPVVNNAAVMIAPTATSRQAISVSGSTLKIAANRRLKRKSDITVLRTDSRSGAKSVCEPRYLRARTTLRLRPAKPSSETREPRRGRGCRLALSPAKAGAVPRHQLSQIRLSAACISLKTPEAVTSTISAPIAEAIAPDVLLLELAKNGLDQLAGLEPSMPSISLTSVPRTASFAEHQPRDGNDDQQTRR